MKQKGQNSLCIVTRINVSKQLALKTIVDLEPAFNAVVTSTKLTGRVYSDSTLAKMKKGALNRPSRNDGTGQNWRRSKLSTAWRLAVLETWNHECAVTGHKLDLVVHHYFSGHKTFKDELSSDLHLRYRDMPVMAIVLSSTIHKNFHDQFGYTNNTLQQFIHFIKMLISSQAYPEGYEGSETRDLKPERLKNLHERLEQILVEENLLCTS